MSSDSLNEWLTAVVRERTHEGRFIVIAHSFPRANSHAIVLITTSRRRFADISIRFRERYPKMRLNIGNYVDEELVNAFFAPSPDVTVHPADQHDDFNSGDQRQLTLVSQILGRLAPGYWDSRGFALIDICGFSQLSTPQQVSQRLVLDGALLHSRTNLQKNLKNRDLATSLSFNRISTGDGYYFWHRRPGAIFDLLTFIMLVLTLARLRRYQARDSDIQVRAAFGEGEAYTLPYLALWDSPIADTDYPPFDDAVGPALNVLARLLGPTGAAPSQLLVADFKIPPGPGPDSYEDPESLITVAPQLLSNPALLKLELKPRTKLRVSDKHGDSYYCYNVVGHGFHWGTREPLIEQIGLVPEDADTFRADMFKAQR